MDYRVFVREDKRMKQLTLASGFLPLFFIWAAFFSLSIFVILPCYPVCFIGLGNLVAKWD